MNSQLPDLSRHAYTPNGPFAPQTPIPLPPGLAPNYGGYTGYLPFGMQPHPFAVPPTPNVPPIPEPVQRNLNAGVQKMPSNQQQPLEDLPPLQTPPMPNVNPPAQQPLANTPAVLPSADPKAPSLDSLYASAFLNGGDPRAYAMQAIYNSGTYKQHLADLLGQGLPMDTAQARATELTVSSNPGLQALYRASTYDAQNRNIDAAYNQNAMNWSLPLGDPGVYSNAVANDPLTSSPLQGAYRLPNGGIGIQAGNNYYDANDSWRSLAGGQALGAEGIYNNALRFAQQQQLQSMQMANRQYQAEMMARARRDQANIIALGRLLSSVSKNLPEASKKILDGVMAQYTNQNQANQTPNPAMGQNPYANPFANPYANPYAAQGVPPELQLPPQPDIPNYGEPF